MKQRGHDAHFLLVSCREVPDQFLVPKDLTGHELVELVNTFLCIVFAKATNLAYKGKELLRGEEIDKESVVNIRAREHLPILTLRWVDAEQFTIGIAFRAEAQSHSAVISLEQVEHQPEQGGLACAIIAYKSYQLAVADMVSADVHCCIVSKTLLQTRNINCHVLIPFLLKIKISALLLEC